MVTIDLTIELDELQGMFEQYIDKKKRLLDETPGTYNEAWLSGECRAMEQWLDLFGVNTCRKRIEPMIAGKAEVRAFNKADTPWYTEIWYDEDLELALRIHGIRDTEENVEKLRTACARMFTRSIGERNEIIDAKVREIFKEEIKDED